MKTLSRNPAIFWYWNTDLSEAGIARQLNGIRDAGFRSVSIHPMPAAFGPKLFFGKGMRIPYLGKTYFRRFRFAVEVCRRLGLRMTLYDEGGWPSGGACGEVVRNDPALAAHVLIRTEQGTFQAVPVAERGRIDLMNPDAARTFIRLTHDRYFESAEEEFGKTITGIFTDEARWVGRIGQEEIPWSPLLPEEFLRRNGFPVEEIYAMLFPLPEITEEVRRMRRLYLECCTALSIRNYYEILAEWCRNHGIGLEGHLSGEDEFHCHAGVFGDAIAVFDCMETPGVDAIWRQIWPGGKDGAFAKFAVSSAIRRKRHEVLSESFNVYGYDLTASSMNWIANAQFIRGVNRLMVMPFLSGIRGGRAWGCCTDFSPRNPLWRLFPALTAHWAWAGSFDAGALEAPVRILYDPALPDSEAEGKLQDARLEALISALDGDRIFWRFAGKEEFPAKEKGVLSVDPRTFSEKDREQWRAFSILPPLPSDGEFQILPCRRNDGTEAVMVFSKGPGEGIFRFRTEPDEVWEEIPPPDPLPSELSPLHRIPGGCEIGFSAGELRIFRRVSSGKMADPPRFRRERGFLEWIVESMEEYRLGSSARPRFSRIGRNLPDGGDWNAVEPDRSGILHLKTSLEFGEGDPLPFCVRFDWIGCGAVLRVNGKKTGIRAFPPWVFRLDGLRKERNSLELEVVGTLAGEWERISGNAEMREKFGNAYSSRIAAYSPDDRRFGVSPEADFFFRRIADSDAFKGD